MLTASTRRGVMVLLIVILLVVVGVTALILAIAL